MPPIAPDEDHWARVAQDWIAWARTPGHDAFWAYRAGLRAFIGPGGGDTLEVGCGEGRVARLLRELGYRVTATDPVAAMVAAAVEAKSADHYCVARAAALPFPDDRFDLVVAYNVLMDVVDMPAAVKEIRRVLRPSGTVVISLVHPFADRGTFAHDAADAPFVVADSYFGRQRFEGAVEREGLRMQFAGWSQPLEAYAAALEAAGLAITSVREPQPDEGAERPYLARWRRMPMFLWLKARPLPR